MRLNTDLENSPLLPFNVRSFRFQWPSDLLTSLAFEMETLILGWYILVETRSVVLLAIFGSLQFLGTLIAPLFGVMGDRLGQRTLMCGMRAYYAVLAITLTLLGMSGLLTPSLVFPLAVLSGLVKPSDLVMRQVLIGGTMPAAQLTSALGLSRMTMDTARIAGALVGASLFSVLGLGYSYVFVSGFYLLSFCLTLGVSQVKVGGTHSRPPSGPAASGASATPVQLSSAWRDLKAGLAYVWNTPKVLAIMWLAFLINLTAIPLSSGLLPYVARTIYQIDAIGLGHLVAAFGVGALIGSILMTVTGGGSNPPRFILLNIILWYASAILFALIETKIAGMALLLLAGLFQSTTMIAMAVALLSSVSEQFRARVMGVRMLAVYGLPVGLLASGVLIDSIGFTGSIAASCAIGTAMTALIGYRWRKSVWN